MNWPIIAYAAVGLCTAEVAWQVRRDDALAQAATVLLWPWYWWNVIKALRGGKP